MKNIHVITYISDTGPRITFLLESNYVALLTLDLMHECKKNHIHGFLYER